MVVLAEGRFGAGVEPEMLTIGKPLSILVPLSISNLSTAALIPCSAVKITLTLRPGTAAAASLRKTSIVLIS